MITNAADLGWGFLPGTVSLGHIANLARQAIDKGHEVVGSDGGRGSAPELPSEAGHFVKLVHDAIEFGIVQAIAEGPTAQRSE